MAYTTVVTHATGDVFPASDWNTYVRDNLAYLHGDSGAISLASSLTVAGSIGAQPGTFVSVQALPGNWALQCVITGDANPRFYITIDGTMNWGLGGAVGTDTNLYRKSANNLQTDGSFWAGISLVLAATAAGTLYFSAALDTYMTRNAAGLLGLNAKLFEGNPALTTVTVPATFTPNLATGLIQRVNVSAGGASTLTIGAPTNAPVSSQTSLLVVQIANNGGGTITIAWNAAFVGGSTLALPASSATGTTRDVLFVWDGANWRILSIG
jgi:hypothetical protein